MKGFIWSAGKAVMQWRTYQHQNEMYTVELFFIRDSTSCLANSLQTTDIRDPIGSWGVKFHWRSHHFFLWLPECKSLPDFKGLKWRGFWYPTIRVSGRPEWRGILAFLCLAAFFFYVLFVTGVGAFDRMFAAKCISEPMDDTIAQIKLTARCTFYCCPYVFIFFFFVRICKNTANIIFQSFVSIFLNICFSHKNIYISSY